MSRPDLSHLSDDPRDYFWGSCLKDDDEFFYKHAHVIHVADRHQFNDTLCGGTGSPLTLQAVYARGKTECSKCLELLNERKKA